MPDGVEGVAGPMWLRLSRPQPEHVPVSTAVAPEPVTATPAPRRHRRACSWMVVPELAALMEWVEPTLLYRYKPSTCLSYREAYSGSFDAAFRVSSRGPLSRIGRKERRRTLDRFHQRSIPVSSS